MIGADGHKAGRVERPDRVIPRLDVIEIDGFVHARQAQYAFHVGREAWIRRDLLAVGFEQAVIGGIKPDQRHEQPDIGFREAGAKEIVAGQPRSSRSSMSKTPVTASS